MVCAPLDLKRQEVLWLVRIVCTLDVSFREFFFLSRYLFHCFVHQKKLSPHSTLFSQFSNCFVCSQFPGLNSILYSFVDLPLYCFK